jgi:hypothetical protein
MIVHIHVSSAAMEDSVGTLGTRAIGADVTYLRVNGDGLSSKLVELLLTHYIASHHNKWGKRSALALAADVHSTC